MTNLPFDFSRCTNKLCAMRDNCLRSTAPWRPDGQQVMTMFIPRDGVCKDQIKPEEFEL